VTGGIFAVSTTTGCIRGSADREITEDDVQDVIKTRRRSICRHRTTCCTPSAAPPVWRMSRFVYTSAVIPSVPHLAGQLHGAHFTFAHWFNDAPATERQSFEHQSHSTPSCNLHQRGLCILHWLKFLVHTVGTSDSTAAHQQCTWVHRMDRPGQSHLKSAAAGWRANTWFCGRQIDRLRVLDYVPAHRPP